MGRKQNLVDAVLAEDVALVEKMLGRGADANAIYDKPYPDLSPLVEAVRCGNIDIVNLLIRAGADVNQRVGENEDTPLGAACQKANLKVVDLLLDKGADPNIMMNGVATPLAEATIDKQAVRTKIVKRLLEGGADAACVYRSADGTPVDSALMRTCQAGSPAAVELLILAGAPVNQQLFFGTALTAAAAAEGDRHEVVLVLLTHGADPKLRVPNDPKMGAMAGKTPLELAEMNGNRRAAEVLKHPKGVSKKR